MIRGIGTDICDLNRLSLNESFVKRILCKEELEVYQTKKTDHLKREYLGGRFAVKEAFIKAYGKIPFQDICCLNDQEGKPYLNYDKCHVSLSHEHDYAIAFVIVEF
ncbi:MULTISPECIES: holo-ACP synthase [Coprobacillaceae]|uniref:holo-ACP synthase n=1 Tax=Coprobacillaceae TaxID=2810280 RepID=UPI000E48B036|nr:MULTISPECIES: holo-ACP synthase [Coprobacillaceae]RHM63710.1 holo-[acyl-carrier-protein] synthase [Coprobacillus sp. AF33-1AC]RHS96439.1 holo-[acyl-carrier-protein] synthase [Erysipelatoclostridium sp. AM42-17]